MTNLRILSINVDDSTTITARFTENLDPSIDTENISIESQLDNIPAPQVLSVNIVGDTLSITTQPMTPQAAYIITFQSTTNIIFQSLNGDAILFQDGITNKQLILGPIESDNVVQDFLFNYLKDNVYNVRDSSTVVNKIIQSLALIMSKALYDIRQVKNENYLSFVVNDEQKTRGSGPFDRLLEEAAYEVIRVGKTPTGTVAELKVSFSDFPYYPVSLLAESAEEALTVNFKDIAGSFNINDFILTVSNPNVSKLINVVFNYSDARDPYVYDVSRLGYQILDSLYDQVNGFSYATLASDQFKLSETILNDPLFSTQNISNVEVEYEFRNLGRIVDASSVVVSTVIDAIRETLPPIINIFSLAHAPIVDTSGNVPSLNGVRFTDPNALNPSAPHSAFLYELPFSLGALPFSPGQYSIDYPTGTVYVFGSDATNSGTGPLPPLATYKYLFSYKNSIDYTYDSDSHALVSLPNGSLRANAGDITFNYEQVLIPGIDYNANPHVEVLSERIENRILALNIVSAKNDPITNVFRIYNETSGEIYNIVRWSGNKIYFSYTNPPNIQQITAERVSFSNSLNEILFVNQELLNTSSLKVYKCLLSNKNIIAGTEDGIGASINTSATFSNANIFMFEKWWDSSDLRTEAQNIDKLIQIGQYQIDYENGVVYVAVGNTQDLNIGAISYKNDSISPQHSHVISVDDIYYRISSLNPKDKQFQFRSFGEGSIVPSTFDQSDEGFLNNSDAAPYEVLDNQVGAIVDATFIPGITNNIKFLRGIYDFSDLQNNVYPLNFAEGSTSSGTNITLGAISRQEFGNVFYDGTNYYVSINLNSSYISPDITFDISIVRNSDAAQLWNGSGSIIAGAPVKLVLPGINSPAAGDAVVITYSMTINDFSRVIVDYNKGDYFVDYSYLADEIIISYEYGDNVLDFRQSKVLSLNETYYASYKVGALRDALLKNFGTLINVPELATFNIDLDRERYRDALTGGLESFIIGPTVNAMKTLVESISHIEPEIIESVFNSWSLGDSLLNPSGIDTEGAFELKPGKYGLGVSVDHADQSITFPVSSNLKLENGSFQAWVIPDWDGLDNDAPITFNIKKNGMNVKASSVFIGALEYHPKYDLTNSFTVDKNSNSIGTPNKNKDGVFIYYDYDPSQLFKRWYCDVVDGYVDGYIIDGYSHNYVVNVKTPGLFYDVKSLNHPQPSTSTIQSGNTNLNFRIVSNKQVREGITFISDREHYLFDFGDDFHTNRFSIFKDPSGYMNFRVYDKKHNAYTVSADVSTWKAHQLHHVATAWSINSKTFRDELHLFIDGFEVPNIIRYGTKLKPYLHEKFRTINPEEIAGVATKDIVGSIDLHTISGSALVSSSINFGSFDINNGDTIFIDETGFNPNGYTITNINGNILTLNTTMPLTLTDARFSINRITVPITIEANVYPNIAVSTLSSILSGSDLTGTINLNTVSSSTNFTTAGVKAGYLIRIEGNSQLESHYTIVNVSGTTLTLDDNLAANVSSGVFHIYQNVPVEIPGVRALRPSYSISLDGYFNNQLTFSNNIKANDLIMVNTLGVNHRRIRQSFYQWGNSSNIIQTRMAPPIDLDTVKIYHVILPTLAINSSNSTIISGNLTSSPITNVSQPSLSDNGRTLAVKVSTNNAVFPVNIAITGIVNGSPLTENLSFTFATTLNTVNKFSSITNFVVSGAMINPSKNFITLQVQEAFTITQAEDSTLYPIIRYSYQVMAGTTLSGTGTTITDANGFFSSLDVGNYIIISSPGPAAGTYQITAVSDDHLSATIDTSLSAFSGGSYQVLNASKFRNGLQNGYFIFEQANQPGTPYTLNSGSYEFDFYTYLRIQFDPIHVDAFIGTDFNKKAEFNGVIDEVKTTSTRLTDTRVGETAFNNVETITKDFNLIKEQIPDSNTLMLIHFNDFPFVNEAPFYITTESKKFVQSGASVNDNFDQSLFITDKPYIIENNGILNSKAEGTIEFWVNPLFDTANDPNYRFYFDAAGIAIENTVSLDDATVATTGRISKILSVCLATDKTVDYFAGGKVETSSIGAIVENALSDNANTITTSRKILQIITIKIVGDPTHTDYFANGTIGVDGTTVFLGRSLPESTLPVLITYKPADGSSLGLNSQVIRLNKNLPNQNTPVVITYVPSGLHGDRISIFKDPAGYINFDISANGTDYLVRTPAYWAAGTWHRIKAVYSVNGGKNTDTLRLFVDGYECGNVLFGSGLIFGDPYVFGSTFSGRGSNIQTKIEFKDFLGELFIGNDFTQSHGAFALIDNLRISDIARPVFQPFGESIDVNYSTNLETVFPVSTDLYTTLLQDFDTTKVKNSDFVMLTNKNSGIFDFAINIFDSFDIIKDSDKVKQVLETLINVLKPASSRVFIKYIR